LVRREQVLDTTSERLIGAAPMHARRSWAGSGRAASKILFNQAYSSELVSKYGVVRK
jgi:hypothetical protein